MLAAFANNAEREMISQRAKAALTAAKARSTKPGTPSPKLP
jgi:DNA invertase Pin-like site-specific DNA recombinase